MKFLDPKHLLIVPFCTLAFAGKIAFAQKGKAKTGDTTMAATDQGSPTTTMPPSEPLMSVRQAVTLSRSNNTAIRESQELETQADLQIPITRSALFPAINGTATANYEKAAANTASTATNNGDPYNAYAASVKAVQPLFAVGSLSAIDSARKGYDIARLNTEITSRNLTQLVVNAYYSVVLANLNIETYLKQEKINRESLVTATQRERTGRGQLLDVLQAKTKIAQLQAQIASARNQAQIAAAQLAFYLGEPQRGVFHVYGQIVAPSIDVIDHQIDLGHNRLPELEKNYIALQQIEDSKQVLLGVNLPKLFANGQYGYSSQQKSDLFSGTSTAWMVGLELDIPIFSGLSYIYQRRQLLSQQAFLEIDKINIENTLSLAQVQSRKALETAQENVESGEEALRLATASSNEARRQYRLATIDFVQLLTVEQSYQDAEASLNQNKYNYVAALAQFYVASGQDLDPLLALLEGVHQ